MTETEVVEMKDSPVQSLIIDTENDGIDNDEGTNGIHHHG